MSLERRPGSGPRRGAPAPAASHLGTSGMRSPGECPVASPTHSSSPALTLAHLTSNCSQPLPGGNKKLHPAPLPAVRFLVQGACRWRWEGDSARPWGGMYARPRPLQPPLSACQVDPEWRARERGCRQPIRTAAPAAPGLRAGPVPRPGRTAPACGDDSSSRMVPEDSGRGGTGRLPASNHLWAVREWMCCWRARSLAFTPLPYRAQAFVCTTVSCNW